MFNLTNQFELIFQHKKLNFKFVFLFLFLSLYIFKQLVRLQLKYNF